MKDTTQVIAVILAVVAVSTAVPQYHTVETRYGDDIVAKEQIELNEEEKYLLATITPIKGKLLSTINLHDFEAGYTAIKDEERDTCYVLELSHTIQEMMDTIKQSVEAKGFFDVTKSFACTKKRVVPNSEIGKYGDRIAKFCEGHEVVYSDKHFLNRKRRTTNTISGNALICLVCISFWCG